MQSEGTLRIVCVAGPSDAGKTSLIERLVPRLAEDGRVATVKSIHHDVDVDTPGSDTDRHRTAGAEAVVGITPETTFEIARGGKRAPPAEPNAGWLFDASEDSELRALEAALDRLRRRGFEYVLVEGYTDAPLPTIVVGDRSDAAVAGEVLARPEDGLETIVRRIRSVDPVDRR